MRAVILAVGVICILLGGLWLLQGLGLVVIPPILCFADCEPLEGPSTTWTLIGLLVLVAGFAGCTYSLRRRRPRQRDDL
jgi:hypothetical protein